MTEEKKRGKCCSILGVVLIILGLLADVIGIGNMPGFGYKQIIIVVLGVVLIVCGAKTEKCLCEKFCKKDKAE